METLDHYRAAADGFVRLVAELPASGWEGPGLGAWDLRSLVGHTSRSLVTVDTYLDRPVEDEDVPTPEDYYRRTAAFMAADPGAVLERGRQAGRALGADPAAHVSELAVRVLRRATEAGDPVIETLVGGMRLSRYLPTRTFELVVHGFDIARAGGLPDPYGPELVADALGLAVRVVAASGQGPAVLLALTGRAPLPAGFSVV